MRHYAQMTQKLTLLGELLAVWQPLSTACYHTSIGNHAMALPRCKYSIADLGIVTCGLMLVVVAVLRFGKEWKAGPILVAWLTFLVVCDGAKVFVPIVAGAVLGTVAVWFKTDVGPWENPAGFVVVALLSGNTAAALYCMATGNPPRAFVTLLLVSGAILSLP
jgi:hypothetical protein